MGRKKKGRGRENSEEGRKGEEEEGKKRKGKTMSEGLGARNEEN